MLIIFITLILLTSGCGGAPSAELPVGSPEESKATPPRARGENPTPAPPTLHKDGASGISIPTGFNGGVFASGLSNPTSMAYGPDGHLYVSQQDGEIIALVDADADGVSDGRRVFASGFNQPLGLAFRGHDLYVSYRGAVNIVKDTDGDGKADARQIIISGLPSGRHQNNGLTFGPDGRLYVTSGSATNAGPEPSPLNATILRANPDGSDLAVYARGLRNPYDLAFNDKGELFATDNGPDPPAFVNAPDELNHIVDGGDYGYPKYAGVPPPDSSTKGPVALFQSYSSSDGIAFYYGDVFPPEYQGDLFVAQWGANIRVPGIGKRVVRVKLSPTGGTYRGEVSDFALGFDNPLDVAVSPKGDLMIADFGSGKIYRIHYTGTASESRR
ncbi:MAG: Glucose/sorbosone dehydrogenase-like [Dehalococcoidia bacterium]|nr:Glucose/sorbosone dehydrogenase-like [Dehalococcoidia bacterium]